MPPPAAQSLPGHSPGNPWSPAAPAREKSSVGSVGSVPESGQEQSCVYGSKQDLWEAFSVWQQPTAALGVLCPTVHTENWQEQSCWQQDCRKFLQALVKGRFWLDLCFLMRWLDPDPCQVSVPLLEPVASCWLPVNRPGLPWVPNWPWHENNYVLRFCVIETFPQKVMKPVITYPVVIALW